MQQSVDVLHVDDEPTFAEMATTFLERENENFIMHTATSAEEGREILADHDIDCIVSDYDMPGTDGIEFLEYVREEYPDLPFILFTGKGSEEVASEALTKGATDYLQKEVGTDHYELLANRIQNAVDKYQATKRAAELDRVRNLASTINQTLIRAKSREEIETRVCEIISDAEPYLFAWIGDVDPDTDHITPRASAGIEEQYLDEITVTADETATGQGPGGTAIRERRVAVSQDVADDPEFEPWRDAALERGFRAVAAVPLEYEETLYGELVVYAERSYAFDDDEQDLLAELGDDIAHAIHGVQTQKQLREERDRRQALFENAPGPVIVGTVLEEEAHHRIVEVNEAFEDVFGYQAEEVIDRPVTEVIVPEEGIATYEEFREQALAGETVTAEVERITADGPREFLLHIIPYGTEDDRVHGTYAWFTDITERKEREQKLHRYKRAMDEAPVGITISDPDQEDNPLIYVNDRFEELTGYDEAAIIGRNCRFLQGEQTESEPVARMRESIDATEPVTVELRNYRNDGSMFWNRVKIAPVEDENGTVTNFVGFQENITERKAREKQLKQYKTLVETVGDAMYSVDADGYIEMVNSAMLEYLEIDRETVIGSHISQYMADDDFERVTELIEELVEDHNRAAATMEFTAITATGAEIPAELNIAVLMDESGTYEGNVGVVRDITKRKEREQQLQQERDRLSALFENLGEPVVETTFDEETAIIENVNSSFEEVFGVTEHNIIGEPLDAKIVPEENYESARVLTRRVKEGGVAEREVQRETVAGLQWFSLRTVPFSLNGERRAFAVYIDISDRKQREEKLQRQKERFEKFASVVSHDLKNPLNVAQGRLELAQEECDSQQLDAVSDAHERMETLIDDMLELAKQGQTVEEPESVDLSAITATCWQNVETADATLRNRTDSRILADGDRLKEMLENLFINAVEHGGSDVTITIGELDTDGFYVEDDGPGIPEDDREKVLESGFSTAEGGTGFGLSIVQEIVAAHGWDLTVTESDMGGARFEITNVEFEKGDASVDS